MSDAGDRDSPRGEVSGDDDRLFGVQDLPGFGSVFNPLRWTPVDSVEYLDQRQWEAISTVLAGCVENGTALDVLLRQPGLEPVSAVDGADPAAGTPAKGSKGGQKCAPRTTYKVCVSYFGPAWRGYAWQKGDPNTVEQAVAGVLAQLVQERELEGTKSPMISVAGRTDAGVSAVGQVVSFYLRSRVDEETLRAALSAPHPSVLRALTISEAQRSFHATFSAKWRRYVYLLPLTPSEDSPAFVGALDAVLSHLQGRKVCMSAFARDTPKGRVREEGSRQLSNNQWCPHSPPQRRSTDCVVHRARALRAALPDGTPVACIVRAGALPPLLQLELAFDRFLRRLVRVLVATAVREAVSGAAPSDVLLQLSQLSERRATAPPAPPLGLVLLEVGYDEWPAAASGGVE